MLFDRLKVRQRVADAVGRLVDPFVEGQPWTEPYDLNEDFGVMRAIVAATTDDPIEVNRPHEVIISVSPQRAEPGVMECRSAYVAVHGHMMRQP
jgi:hypothetical protein